VAGGERSETEAHGAEARGGTGTHRGEEPLAEERGPGHERDRDRERGGVGAARGTEDDDELRVQRTEEELRAGTREREAGGMYVRKRVRTDREQVRVPTRREEVSVERVPVNEERTGAEIGDDEVSVPVVEEEAVVDKQAVVKEEVRIRKEEVDIDDQTERGRGRGTDLDDETRRRGN
jgi:uncharacterized protein (TIGR02271 family)